MFPEGQKSLLIENYHWSKITSSWQADEWSSDFHRPSTYGTFQLLPNMIAKVAIPCSKASMTFKGEGEPDLCAHQEWKGYHRLLVSGLACEELGSHHTILTTSKKLSKPKNQQLLDLSEKWSHKTKYCPPNWRDRQVNTESHNLLEQKPLGQLGPGQKNLTCNWKTAGSSGWTSLKVKTSGGPPHFCFTSGSWPGSTVNIGEKSPHAFGRWRGN